MLSEINLKSIKDNIRTSGSGPDVSHVISLMSDILIPTAT